MNSSRKADKPDKYSGSVWVLLLGLMATTIYFNENFEDPFNTAKLIILLVTAGWLSGHVINYYSRSKISFNSSHFWLVTLCTLFGLFQLVSLVFTDIFIVGLIGDTQRRNGFLSYLAFIIILLFAAIRMNTSYIIRFLRCSVFTALLLSVYGLMQINGNDFVNWNNPYNSMISTLGNPNFASALLAILVLILALLLPIKSIGNIYKLISAVAVPAAIYAIYKSNSRQGLFVIIFGILFYLLLYFYFNHPKLKLVVTSFILVTSGILTAGMLQAGPLAKYIYKDSVSVRGYYWDAALKMFLDKPLFGVGLDRYESYFKEYRDVGYPLKYGFEITSSNAHNVYLQFFSTGGIFVGISYLLLLFFVFIHGIRNIQRNQGDDQKIALLLLSAWIGFQAQSLISIDNIGLSIWGWILSGCILGLNFNQSHIQPPDLKFNQRTKSNSISLFQPVVSTLILIPTLIVSTNLWNTENSMRSIRQWAYSDIQTNKTLILEHTKELNADPLADPNYKFYSALFLVDAGDVDNSFKQVSKILQDDPRHLGALKWLAEYARLKGKIQEEIQYRNRISTLDPWNAENLYLTGMAYKNLGDASNAKVIFERIIGFAPGTSNAIKAQEEIE